VEGGSRQFGVTCRAASKWASTARDAAGKEGKLFQINSVKLNGNMLHLGAMCTIRSLGFDKAAMSMSES
jgi:hypothetical protein